MLALLGMAFSVVPKVLQFFGERDKVKNQNKHELAMMQLQKDINEARETANTDAAYLEWAGKKQVQNYKSAEKITLAASQWCINLSACVRPGVTLLILTYFGYVLLEAGIDDQNQIVIDVVTRLLALTEVVVGYWFGDRSIQKIK